MKTIPFWTDGLERPAELRASPLPERVDVAIVGGGYTGLNAARVLAQNGASVAVLERHTIGWGASSRNGGMATTGIKAPAAVMVQRYGKALGRAFWQASLEAIDLIEAIVAEEGIECHFSRPGHVALAYKPAHFEAMKQRAAWFQKELDYTMRPVSPADLRSEIGSKAFYGGLVDEYSAGLHPAKYVLGLGAAVARRGVCLCEETAVSRIEKGPAGFQVYTSQGVVAAREVLVATNGYTDRLLPGLKPRIFAVGSYIIVTEPLPPAVHQQLSPKGRMFYDSKNFLNYFRLTPDGRMLFGGRNNLRMDLDLAESARRLGQRMVEVFPELGDVPITHSWTGQLGLTFDLMPHIGRIEGVHYALGYCGHGVSIATYLGTEVGLLLAGKKSSSPFMEIPHETRFFYRGRPWFLPLAAVYYRVLDWVK
ncbi:MAG: FAD-binding oxidoreductase [Chloroflexi bacterium]|nr:FAD-binding oxidoreductase [Chloroflexota bacterium]MCI0574811.1 FAD-binding oxidoreductase [Chloroflexota bacterium]MCI0649832.1 FAD-binding oxidoreductase [Chloroflexota bacterium]MCI0729129.1 FAD-binding oxidoreductase [Chloroflexota bacterium]